MDVIEFDFNADSGKIVSAGIGDPPSWRSNPAMVYLSSLGSKRSRETQNQRLDKIAGLLTNGLSDCFSFRWETVTGEISQAVRMMLCDEVSPKTGHRLAPSYVNAHLAALRSVLKEAWRLGLMTEEQRARACDLKPVKGTTLPSGRVLNVGEKAALFAVCRHARNAKGDRDSALFALGFGCGMSRSEIVSVRVEDYSRELLEIRIFEGRARESRIAYLPRGYRMAIDEWLIRRGPSAGNLLVPVRKGGTILYRRMADHAIYLACQRRAEEAGIKPFSPHDMRRTFINDLLEAGVDISVAQRLAGHKHVSTTQKYDRRSESVLREGADAISFDLRRAAS